MREAPGVDDFQRDPIGSYVVERKFLCWSFDPTLWGCIYWGSFAEDDVRSLIKALEAELQPDVPPHVGLADLRRLGGAEPFVHDLLARYLQSRWEVLRTRIVRQAVVRPPGMLGSLVAGFYEVHAPSYPFRTWTEPLDALAWLGRAQDAWVLEQLEQRVRGVISPPQIVDELRALLARGAKDATLGAAARQLGASTRTLQRHLRDAGTSFQTELQSARLRSAQRMLLETDAKLASIALEVGFASLQHFSEVFRRLTGESPGAWRARRRGRDAAGPLSEGAPTPNAPRS